MENPFISIIVIGKNEAKNLSRLHASLEPLKNAWSCETIFVDSASRDNSVEVARTIFDKVILLSDSPHLNASAGRSVGVNIATGKWALFLDGDMELISDCITHLREHFEKESEHYGAVGNYVHRFSDGSVSRWSPNADRRRRVNHFGGAVLLPTAVLQRENWDPRLYSNEEIDLYTRLRSHGYHVLNLGVDFISHWTLRVSTRDKLFGNFYPHGSYLGKKFYGVGQLLSARVTSGRLTNLIRWWPEPFALWTVIILAPLASMLGGWALSLSLLAIVSVAITLRYSWKSIVGFIAFLPQAIYGSRHFVLNWAPAVAATYLKGGDEPVISMLNRVKIKGG